MRFGAGTMPEFKPGDRVRSFDFPRHRDLTGPDAVFIEGTLVEVQDHNYVIKVEKAVWEGEEIEDSPPVVMPRIDSGAVEKI